MTDATSDLLQITIIINLISIYVFCRCYFEMYISTIIKKKVNVKCGTTLDKLT